MTSSVTVVVVNFNGGTLISRCLQALQRQTINHDVLVIDNASTDGSARQAHQTNPLARFIPLRYNVGFARAVNIASDRLQSDVMVLLNPDTHPEPEFLEQLTAPIELGARIGAVGGTLVFDSAPDTIASAGIRVHRNGIAIDDRAGEPRRTGGSPQPVFGASGGAAAFRLDAFHDAGRFPDSFLMYLEDVDLAWRLRMRGWDAMWAPGAVASHAYSASAGEGSPFKRRLLARNRIWTLVRCLPDEFWERDGAQILGFDTAAFLHGLTFGNRASALGRVEAIAKLWPRLCERRWIQSNRTVELHELDPWIYPPMSPRAILRLRNLTARLASNA